jgi:hypothetical protein
VIESIGYTEDGFVWMNIVFEREGQKGTIVLTMPPNRVREISKTLITAADGAEKHIKVLQ